MGRTRTATATGGATIAVTTPPTFTWGPPRSAMVSTTTATVPSTRAARKRSMEPRALPGPARRDLSQRRCGQREPKGAAAAGRALHADGAVHRFHQVLHNGE